MNIRPSRRSPVTEPLFHAVMKDVRSSSAIGHFNANAIAIDHNVSVGTVNAMRRAKTWPQWLRDKKASSLSRTRPRATQGPGRIGAGLTAGTHADLMARPKTLTLGEYNELTALKDDVDDLVAWRKGITSTVGLKMPKRPRSLFGWPWNR